MPSEMEENKSSLMKQAMTFGAIIGLILVVFSVLLYMTGQTFNKGLGFVQYVVLFAGIYWGSRNYRDKVLNGSITYGRALGLGLWITIFVGIITLFFNFIMIRYIDQGLIDKYMAIVEETMENNRFLSSGDIESGLERARKFMTSVWSIPMGLISFTLIGLVMSLITSALVRRNPNPVA